MKLGAVKMNKGNFEKRKHKSWWINYRRSKGMMLIPCGKFLI